MNAMYMPLYGYQSNARLQVNKLMGLLFCAVSLTFAEKKHSVLSIFAFAVLVIAVTEAGDRCHSFSLLEISIL